MKVNANGWGKTSKKWERLRGGESHKRAEAGEAVRAIFRVSGADAVITLCRHEKRSRAGELERGRRERTDRGGRKEKREEENTGSQHVERGQDTEY